MQRKSSTMWFHPDFDVQSLIKWFWSLWEDLEQLSGVSATGFRV